MIGGYVLPQLEHLIQPKGSTMNAETEMGTSDGLGAEPLSPGLKVEDCYGRTGTVLHHEGRDHRSGEVYWAVQWEHKPYVSDLAASTMWPVRRAGL